MDLDQVLPVMARSVYRSMRGNFQELESTRPNQMGGKRTHYYAEARRDMTIVYEGDTAIVGTTLVGTNLRYFGGTVKAGANPSYISGKPTKFLTIPATAESYGRRAADFPELEVLFGRNGPYALARVERRTIARGDTYGVSGAKSVEILFWLKSSVTVQPDESMLPDPSGLNEAVKSDVNDYVGMLWRRSRSGGN
jgi:hypothetical protein